MVDKAKDDLDDWMEEHLASTALPVAPPPPPVGEASVPAAAAAENEPKSKPDPWLKTDPWGGKGSDTRHSDPNIASYQTENPNSKDQSGPTANTETNPPMMSQEQMMQQMMQMQQMLIQMSLERSRPVNVSDPTSSQVPGNQSGSVLGPTVLPTVPQPQLRKLIGAEPTDSWNNNWQNWNQWSGSRGDKIPFPKWDGSHAGRRLKPWLKELRMWRRETDVPVQKQGLALYRSFDAGNWMKQAAERVPEEQLYTSEA